MSKDTMRRYIFIEKEGLLTMNKRGIRILISLVLTVCLLLTYPGSGWSSVVTALAAPGLQDLDGGEILYLPFEEGVGITASDLSGMDNHGTLQTVSGSGTGVGWTENGKFGKALEFQGTDGFVRCGKIPQLSENAPNVRMSIEFWAKRTGDGAGVTPGLISQRGQGWGLIWHVGDALYTRVYQSDGKEINSGLINDILTVGTWRHIVLTAGESTVNTYIDGKLKKSVPYDGTVLTYRPDATNNADLLIGRQTSNFFQGILDEIKIYNQALSPEQILEHYQRGIDPDKLLFLPMDEGQGSVAYNTNGQGNNNAVLKNGAAWTTGRTGTGIELDGKTGYLDCGLGADLNYGDAQGKPGSITVSLWAKRTGKGSGVTPGLISNRDRGFGLIWLSNEDSLNARIYQADGAAIESGELPAVFPLHVWRHIVLTADGAFASIYIDGVLKQRMLYNGTLNPSTAKLFIGMQSNQMFQGVVDDVRLFRSGKNAEEVLSLYKEGSDAHALLDLRPEEGQARDFSGNDHHGVFQGGSGQSVGLAGNAFYFNGQDGLINVGNKPTLDAPNQMAVEFWVRRTGVGTGVTPGIISKRDNGWGLIWQSGTALNARIYQSDGKAVNSGPINDVLKLNAWRHVVLNANGQTVDVFVDGHPVRSVAYDGTIKRGLSNLVLGFQQGQYFQGNLDAVRIYDKALSAEQIITHFNDESKIKNASVFRQTYVAYPESMQIIENGFVEEDGERIYKLQVEFSKRNNAQFMLPLNVYFKSDLTSNWIYKADAENLDYSFNAIFDLNPAFPNFAAPIFDTTFEPRMTVLPVAGYQPTIQEVDGWTLLTADKTDEYMQNVGYGQISEKYFPEAATSSYTPVLKRLAVYLNAMPGGSITLRFRDISVVGQIGTTAEMFDATDRGWAQPAEGQTESAQERYLARWTSYTQDTAAARQAVASVPLHSPDAEQMRVRILADIDALSRELSAYKSRQYIYIRKETENTYITRISAFQEAAENLILLDQQLVSGKPLVIGTIAPASDAMLTPDIAGMTNLLEYGVMKPEITMSATPGEYEPGSFIVYSQNGEEEVLATASDLVNTVTGKRISRKKIDIRLVKNWYQTKFGWQNVVIRQPESPKLVPELLLHDDALIKVDQTEKKNYVWLNFPEGGKTSEYYWISATDEKRRTLNPVPEDLADGKVIPAVYGDPAKKEDTYKLITPEDGPLYDATSLQPVSVKSKALQQFWVTVNVPRGAKAGEYAGTISLTAGGRDLGTVVLKLVVHSFKLDFESNSFTSSIYYRSRINYLGEFPNGTVSSEYRTKDQLVAELKNMVAHGVTNPTFYQYFDGFNKPGNEAMLQGLRDHMDARVEAGITSPVLYSCYGIFLEDIVKDTGTPLEQRVAAVRQSVSDIIAYLGANYGITDIYFYGLDEATAESMKAQKEIWKAVREGGGKIFVAGTVINNLAMIDEQDVLVSAGPVTPQMADYWHNMTQLNDPPEPRMIFSYANPQAGVENPAIYRRNYGLLLWQSNYDGACDFALNLSYGNIWNDFDHPAYRDQNFAYPTVDGLIDTLAWEGYREGMDDIRYVLKLQEEIKRAQRKGGKKKGNQTLLARAREAQAYLDELKTANLMLLDYQDMRARTAAYITLLQNTKG